MVVGQLTDGLVTLIDVCTKLTTWPILHVDDLVDMWIVKRESLFRGDKKGFPQDHRYKANHHSVIYIISLYILLYSTSKHEIKVLIQTCLQNVNLSWAAVSHFSLTLPFQFFCTCCFVCVRSIWWKQVHENFFCGFLFHWCWHYVFLYFLNAAASADFVINGGI